MIRPTVSILIKALNEEDRIVRCLRAAVDEASAVGGEVILVDSLSTDRTVDLALGFPEVRIVQFVHPSDIGCGAAVQLGYQYSQGDYLYILDADMVLQPGFIGIAIERLNADARLAGIAGKLVDIQVNTMADRRRVEQATALASEQYVGELGGGGLYRRSAIASVGYLSNRWLKAYEEADLGVRLRANGWKLLRLDVPSVSHEGHEETDWEMLRRLWRNGRAAATGVFISYSLFRPWFWLVVQKLAHIYSAVLLQFLQLIPVLLLPSNLRLPGWVCYWCTVLAALTVRKRSLSLGAWALFSWHYLAVAAFVGLGAKRRDPVAPIEARELRGLPLPAPAPCEALIP